MRVRVAGPDRTPAGDTVCDVSVSAAALYSIQGGGTAAGQKAIAAYREGETRRLLNDESRLRAKVQRPVVKKIVDRNVRGRGIERYGLGQCRRTKALRIHA